MTVRIGFNVHGVTYSWIQSQLALCKPPRIKDIPVAPFVVEIIHFEVDPAPLLFLHIHGMQIFDWSGNVIGTDSNPLTAAVFARALVPTEARTGLSNKWKQFVMEGKQQPKKKPKWSVKDARFINPYAQKYLDKLQHQSVITAAILQWNERQARLDYRDRPNEFITLTDQQRLGLIPMVPTRASDPKLQFAMIEVPAPRSTGASARESSARAPVPGATPVDSNFRANQLRREWVQVVHGESDTESETSGEEKKEQSARTTSAVTTAGVAKKGNATKRKGDGTIGPARKQQRTAVTILGGKNMLSSVTAGSASKPLPRSAGPAAAKYWGCSTCGYLNDEKDTKCQKCQAHE